MMNVLWLALGQRLTRTEMRETGARRMSLLDLRTMPSGGLSEALFSNAPISLISPTTPVADGVFVIEKLG